jgi:hypothetical protein
MISRIKKMLQGKSAATSQATSASKKDKVKQVLALVTELQIQVSICSDDELEVLQSS